MKKLFLVACVAAFCLTGCNNGKNDSAAQNTAQADSLNGIIAQKDSEINDLLGTLNEIEEGFQQISEAEHRLLRMARVSTRSRSSRKTSSSLLTV